MKYLKEYNIWIEVNESFRDIKKSLKVSKFKELPIEYKESIVIRALEINEDIEWVSSNINDAIIQYQDIEGDRLFYWGEVPIDIIKEQIMSSDIGIDFDSFEDYHIWYGDPGNRYERLIPIIIGDPGEFISDGWHRFHSYVDRGVDIIPVIAYYYN